MRAMKRWVVLAGLMVAFLAVELPSAYAQHIYNNGVGGGAATPIPIGTATPVVLLIARPGQARYSSTIQCTVPVNTAWGTLSGPPSPEVSATLGFPLAADQAWVLAVDSLIVHLGDGPWDFELDAISTSGTGTCSTHEETLK